MNEKLLKLARLIDKSEWLESNELEPNVGDFGCPEVPKGYGTRGQSLFTAFITEQGEGVYKCAFERCFAQSAQSLEEAIRHIRSLHFNHSPFPCLITNGVECGRRFHAQIDLTNHQNSAH